MSEAWWKNAVVYEIYIRSFFDSNGDGIGDLEGIRQKLPYIETLGADAIWITPFFQSPRIDNGYDISDYTAIDPEYGTMDDFRLLLQDAHERGIRVILDMVLNHTSSDHPWFQESRSSRLAEKRDWYIWCDVPNNWGSQFGGSAWHYDESSRQYYLGLFSAAQPDLNWRNPKVREALKEVLRFWAETGVDGFRLDVISLIGKPTEFLDAPVNESGFSDFHPFVANQPEAHKYLHELRKEVFEPYGLVTIGEAAGVTLEEAAKYCAPDREELDMVFQFEHVGLDGSEAYKWTDRRIDVEALKKVLYRWQTGAEGCFQNTLFWCNHDQPRIVSRLGDTGALRERSAKMLMTVLFLMEGTVFLYQGQELGTVGGGFKKPEELRDIEGIQAYRSLIQGGISEEAAFLIVAEKTRDNARTLMQWSSEKNAGFSEGTPWIKAGEAFQTINAAEQLKRENSPFSYCRRLLRLRREDECFTNGSFRSCDNIEGVIAYERGTQAAHAFVIGNMTAETKTYKLPKAFESGEILITNCLNSDYIETGILQPYECLVVKAGSSQESQTHLRF